MATKCRAETENDQIASLVIDFERIVGRTICLEEKEGEPKWQNSGCDARLKP